MKKPQVTLVTWGLLIGGSGGLITVCIYMYLIVQIVFINLYESTTYEIICLF